MKAQAVIGLNFGDEGKGITTDFLATPESIVVRYNGGAQAGHTVVTPNGHRHVFHHVGAGTFQGAATYLSRHFITNPYLYLKEADELMCHAYAPFVHVDREALLTTPYDMLINQELERGRKDRDKHGSCGIGINETVQRCLGEYKTIVGMLPAEQFLEKRLQAIRKDYVPARLAALGVEPSEWLTTMLASDSLRDNYLFTTCRKFLSSVHLTDVNILDQYDHVVFEGAQGLLLDEHHRFFPHVTRSRPGLPNILDICKDIRVRELEVIYVTRSYMTRHGAGPFPSEGKMVYPDATNSYNEWQGYLRFGMLDTDLMQESYVDDLAHATSVKISGGMCMTHLDQTGNESLALQVAEAIGMPLLCTSHGPLRTDMRRKGD